MKSLSKSNPAELPEIKRQWSILPVRALLDRDMTQSEFRVLCAMCIYTNAHGVCWPGTKTIGAIVGTDHGNVSRTIQKLVRRKYVRKLEPKDFQMEFAKFGKINRYQVLYEEGAALPSWEEVQSSMILAPSDEVPDTHINDIGGAGDDDRFEHTLAHSRARLRTRRAITDRAGPQRGQRDQPRPQAGIG
jgi:hypothetical protein